MERVDGGRTDEPKEGRRTGKPYGWSDGQSTWTDAVVRYKDAVSFRAGDAWTCTFVCSGTLLLAADRHEEMLHQLVGDGDRVTELRAEKTERPAQRLRPAHQCAPRRPAGSGHEWLPSYPPSFSQNANEDTCRWTPRLNLSK